MKKYLLLLLFIFNTAFAALTASLDRTTINFGESVNLTISSDSANNLNLDLSPLNQQFQILGSSNSMQISTINGAQTQQSQQIIVLLPKQSGTLTIPVFKLGKDATRALTLSVKPASQTALKNAPVFLEASVSPNAYVNSQVDYFVKVFYRVSGISGQLTPPQLDNINLQILGNDRQYQLTREGRTYQILERHYVFFPQQAGTINFSGTIFDGTIPIDNPRTANNLLWAFSGGRSVRLISPAVNVTVKNLPAGVAFAARSVKLSAKWASALQNLTVGQPITRTLHLEAEGVLGNQLSALNPPLPAHTNAYPEQPKINTNANNNEVIGTRDENIAYISQQSGSLTFPEIKLTWLNTTSGKIETAIIPAEQINVAAGASVLSNPPALLKAVSSPISPHAISTKHYWLWAIVILVLLILGSLLLAWRWLGNKAVKVKINPRKAIQLACEQHDVKALQQAILSWASENNLGAVIRQAMNPEWRHALQELEAFIYKNNTLNYDFNACWQAFLQQEKYQPEEVKRETDLLPPLHPKDPPFEKGGQGGFISR